jgi:hypothetical protein
MVAERACSSGATIEDRLLPTEIDYGPTTVVVAFHVDPLPQVGTDGEPITQACEGVITPVPVELSEPLGERPLADGWSYPPRPAEEWPAPSTVPGD